MRVRYIKLGPAGTWWQSCKKNGEIRLGFDTGTDKIYKLATKNKWSDIKEYWKNKTGTPTQHTNQTRAFFEDNGNTIWITFEEGCLYYTVSNGDRPYQDKEKFERQTSILKAAPMGWTNLDKKGNILFIDNLSGRLTKTAGYRQTICSLTSEAENYLRRRLWAEQSPDIKSAEEAKFTLIKRLEPLIKSLTWHDFELLVELIFSQSGLRRLSKVGGKQKTTDFDLENIVTGEKAFVQVKSKTTQNQLDNYVSRKTSEKQGYARMYYAYHSGRVTTRDESVEIWDCRKIASLTLETGLQTWLIDRAK